ncbi:MAG: hypothetical protein MUF85_02410 [Patescibacteria group bacterium]|jgi:hypothetical protein|nr:hypothetical protein [Patescibacteria group bacterium]
MDSLKDLLVKKNLDEPTEISALRAYCEEIFNVTPKISINGDILWCKVPNGIIATELRMRQLDVVSRCGITKKLRITIG